MVNDKVSGSKMMRTKNKKRKLKWATESKIVENKTRTQQTETIKKTKKQNKIDQNAQVK